MLAVKCTEPLGSPSGPLASAARLAARVPPEGWLCISAGLGAKGRRRRSWYRWVTLAMLAYAFLVVAAVTEHARHPPPLGSSR